MDFPQPLDDVRDHATAIPKNERSVQGSTHSALNIESRIEQLREQPRRKVTRPKSMDQQSSNSQPEAENVTSVGSRSRERDRKHVERRSRRTSEPSQQIGLHLRPEEQDLLYDVGRFRVISVDDLVRHVYEGNPSQLRNDLQYLRQANLIDIHKLNQRRDGRGGRIEQFEAVALTKAARKILERAGSVPANQRVYAGLVKRREAEHDCQIYGAFQKEIKSLNLSSSRDVRVQLDFELKANFNRAVYLARKSQPSRDQAEIKQEVAQQLQLHISNGKVIVPDARLEYELPDGTTARVEIEIATAAYRHGHITAKTKAGFKLYMSQGDIGRLGAGIQDDQDLMSEILSL